MKLNINTINPKRIFRSSSFSRSSTKSRSVSRSDPQSLSSGSTASTSSSSSSSSGSLKGGDSAIPTTPTTVLPFDYSHYELTQAFNLVNKHGGAAAIPSTDIELLLSRSVSDSDSGHDFVTLLSDSDAGPDLREAFDIFDGDGDGKISAEELLKVFTSIGDRCTLEDCRRMISGVDTDGDGFVCFEDFSRMMMMGQEQQQLHR